MYLILLFFSTSLGGEDILHRTCAFIFAPTHRTWVERPKRVPSKRRGPWSTPVFVWWGFHLVKTNGPITRRSGWMLQGPKLLQPERSSGDLPPTPNYLMGKWNAASDLQAAKHQLEGS